jgi:hypothetical protein
MSDFSRDEHDVLAGARRALEPSAQDAARVLHNARLAIGNGAVPAADAAPASGAANGALIGALAKKAASWLAVAGIAAWLGYAAGLSRGEQHARDANGATARAASAPVSQLPRAAAPPIEGAPPSARSAEAPALAPEAAPAAPAMEPPRRKPKLVPEPALAPEVDEAPALAAPPPAPSASLDAEIKALRYVERALRNREPQNALARLAQLDREVPNGQMREERAAAHAMARCEARAVEGKPDHAQVMQRVLEFSQRYPASVYFARVRQTCLATIDRDAATD